MITLVCQGHTFGYEMEHIVRMFFPGKDVKTVFASPEPTPERHILTAVEPNGILSVKLRLPELDHPDAMGDISESAGDNAVLNNETERKLGVLLFNALHNVTGIRPPWGIQTGVRPVRLCRQWQSKGMGRDAVFNRLTNEYLVCPEKAELALRTADVQQEILARNTSDSYSLYISIPFCPTRCLYCSFVSHAIDRAAKLIPDYLNRLDEELRQIAAQARKLGLTLHTVYVGGGTPTALETRELKQVLEAVDKYFDRSGLMEYTVEAGRPDTITAEKLELLRRFGVDRISINPQTMDDTILETIGRAHTARQTEDSYKLARDYGFSAVNMDLIAGLPGETPESFAKTLDRILHLAPENITLHTLTVKRSSTLRERESAYSGSPYALDHLLETTRRRLGERGYRPYYLYRQKGTVQNLENTGFSLPGKEGVYNIYSMEEVHTILAAGAGAITKLCRNGHIRRVCNFKYPYEYIGRFDELMERKASVEEFYEKHTGEEIHTR